VAPIPQRALVLVAHDTKVVADMIDGILRKAGMTMAYARNGLEALKKATSLRPQAMIVDVGLTGIFGFELCERLKNDPDTAGIKIILLSSVYGLTAYKREPVTLYGADDYIEKHHIPDELVPKLNRLLFPEHPVPEKPAPSPPEPDQEEMPVRTAGSSGPRFPLISRKGIVQSPRSRPDTGEAVLECSPEQEGAADPRTVHGAAIGEAASPPSGLPDTPRDLEREGETTEAPPALEPSAPAMERTGGDAPEQETDFPGSPVSEASPWPDTAAAIPADLAAMPASGQPTGAGAVTAGTMAEFFEQHEYAEPSPTSVRAAADLQEIEKARRFARLIVSDIVLYNQDAVAEGIRAGTFYELLHEDISEGRSLYEKRVPEAIRATKDYLQEAFDDFIISKRKPR
jgi:CheY-like chemotaxis protein